MYVASVAVEKTAFCFDKLLDYLLPEDMVFSASVGSFVLVPFGISNKIRQAVIFSIEEKTPKGVLKSVLKVISKEVFITKELMSVACFLHSRCFCSWYDTVRAVLPAGFFYNLNTYWKISYEKCLNLSEEEIFILNKLKCFTSKESLSLAINNFILDKKYKFILNSLIDKNILVNCNDAKRKILDKNMIFLKVNEFFDLEHNLTKKQKLLFDYVKNFEEVALKQACYICGVTEVVAKNLQKLGALVIFEKNVYRNPYKHVKKLRSVGDVILNKEQEIAKDGIIKLINKGIFDVALLKGVTGSGKTHVLLKLIDFVLKSGKDVIFLVPEISLTAQMVYFFQSFFGDAVAVLHSGISASEQVDEYRRILNGIGRLIIGTRSAVFAPCKSLGLIIMDEEEGSCYKSSDMSPRYDAKDVAKYRCFKSFSILVLSSATPSVETYYFAKKGIYKKFVLKQRYNGANFPKIFVVDMKKDYISAIPGVSRYLFEEIVKNFESKEQSIIFLNRRGYHINVFCLDCGGGIRCKNCSAFMVYHSVNSSFMCHYCGYILKEVKNCSLCGSNRLNFCGQGTQKIEYGIKKYIKGAKVLRLDGDSIYSRLDLEEKIKSFEKGEYDILVGTQIVARGLNFLNVTLVGVLSADSALCGADFKSSERAFSLLTQVVGRSGRAKKKGRAIIQTTNPANNIIYWAAKQDYDMFFENEILERKEFFCPPFCDLFIVNFSGPDRKKLYVCAEEFILQCKKDAVSSLPFFILGISTPYIEMLNRRYRKRVIIKCRNSLKFRNWMKKVALKVFSSKNFASVRANIDINGDII